MRTSRRILAGSVGVLLAACFSDTPVEPSRPGLTSAFNIRPAAAGRITVLGDLGGTGGSTATGVNATGQIVGYSYAAGGGRHVFLWEDGTMTDLGARVPPPGGESVAGDIGDGGQVVGTTYTAEGESGSSFAVVWENGIPRKLDRLVEPLRATATAVNAGGTVVGGAYNADWYEQPVLWDSRGIVDLGLRGGGLATDINDRGQIVGRTSSPTGWWGAFLWQNGGVRDLGTLAGGNTVAMGINEAGQVVGWSSAGWGEEHAFLWADGRMTDLGTLGGSMSVALNINDNGQVVGYSTTSNSTERVPRYHAFVWERGVMTDLGTLGGDRTIGQAINNSGVIVGESNYTRGGDTEAVRWTVPTTDFWSEMAVLPTARRGLAVGTAAGLLYAIGGDNSSGTALASVEAFDPGTNTYSRKAPMPAPRRRGNGAATVSGTIYVAGGRDAAAVLTRTLYAYDPSANRWSVKAPMPVAGGCGGSAAIGGRLYVFSGCVRSSSGETVGARLLQRYDPGTNSWTTLRSAPSTHFSPAVGAIGGKLYVAGGSNDAGVATRRVDMYDPARNTWSTRAEMPTSRMDMSGAVVAGRLYVVGGRNASGTLYRDAVEVYDPVANSWSTRAEMIAPRAGFGAGAVNGILYVVGGRNKVTTLRLNERYTP